MTVPQHPMAKPETTLALIILGAAGKLFEPSNIQTVYYCLLIPPAALSLYLWFKEHIWPSIKEWFR